MAQRIGFIGAGLMGHGMAKNVVRLPKPPPPPRSGWKSLVFDGEADLDHELVVGDAAVLDVAASLDHLEPAQSCSVLAALATAFCIASSMLLSDEPASSIIL